MFLAFNRFGLSFGIAKYPSSADSGREAALFLAPLNEPRYLQHLLSLCGNNFRAKMTKFV